MSSGAQVADLHCYAWKAPIIIEVAREVGNSSVVMWVDSGAAIAQPLANVVAAARANGGYVSDETAKGVARFSHEGTLDYFEANFGLDSSVVGELKSKRARGEPGLDSTADLSAGLAKFRNCNGAFSAHVFGGPRFESVSKHWLACSLVKDCVCPPKSHRGNHRQDQAALTLLSIMDGYVCGTDGKFVAAHGLRNAQHILQAHGVHSAKELTDKEIFCAQNATAAVAR